MAAARALTEHDEIRHWAEQRGARPACVKGTGGRRGKGDVGMIRLDFPGFSGEGSLQKISWDEWFRQFDDNNLALMIQGQGGRGQGSNFNKLVSRDSVKSSSARRAGSSRQTAAGRRTSARRAAGRRPGKQPASGVNTRRAAGSRTTQKAAGARKRQAARSHTRRAAGARKTAQTRGSRKTTSQQPRSQRR